MKNCFLLLFSCVCISSYGQQDLLSMLDSAKPATKEKVFATFKTTKVINAQSTETVKKHTLDFRITHRFGDIGTEGGGSAHDLYGLDNISDYRISFDYGITDNLMIGVGRSKLNENIDGTIKWRFLDQTTDNHSPVSATLYGNAALTPEVQSSLYSGTTDSTYKFSDRLSYVTQIIIARKFSRSFSLEILPTYFHRNYVKALTNPNNNAEDQNDMLALGGALRMKVSKRMAILVDYFHVFSDFRTNNPITPYYDPLAVGIEIETGGHVFHLNFTNASGIIENYFLANTTDSWSKGGMKFGFNISRVFNL